MSDPADTIIIRHPKERLSKCSLHGLEDRADLEFVTFTRQPLPDIAGRLSLSLEGPVLGPEHAGQPMLLIDATWRLAGRIHREYAVPLRATKPVTLPSGFVTAYPRRQDDCADPDRGLASVEALYIAYHVTGRDTTGLLDHYHWADDFLEKNAKRLAELKPAS